jgi:hypothetical protein
VQKNRVGRLLSEIDKADSVPWHEYGFLFIRGDDVEALIGFFNNLRRDRLARLDRRIFRKIDRCRNRTATTKG